MNRTLEITKWFYLVTSLVLTIQITSCGVGGLLADARRPTICFVLPDGYSGAFQLILDEKNGINVTEKDGKYVYDIPPGGSLSVKTFRPFETPSKYVAMYKAGSIIPTEDSTNPDTVALRLLGNSRHNDGPLMQTNFIGTKDEAIRAKTDQMAGRLRLGKH
jgi:hypothetical protein